MSLCQCFYSCFFSEKLVSAKYTVILILLSLTFQENPQ
eukprot:UN11697